MQQDVGDRDSVTQEEPASLACHEFQADLDHHLQWLKEHAEQRTRAVQIAVLLQKLRDAM